LLDSIKRIAGSSHVPVRANFAPNQNSQAVNGSTNGTEGLMGVWDRRDFLKSGLGAGAAVVGASILGEMAAGAAQTVPPVPEYEIYACKYGGPLVRKVAVVLWNTAWDEDGPINYYVWAIKARNGETIVVDTGCSPAQGAARKVPGFVNPVEVLGRLGATADSVSKVVITHMHWDHVGNIEAYLQAFPKAKFYVQQREFDFCVKNPVVNRKPIAILFDPLASQVVGGLAGSDRLVLVNGDYNLAPGVDLSLAPGHTLGLQVVRVNTAKGPAVVGSDCAHVFRGYRENIPSCFIMDMPAWVESFDKVKAKASLELIFPGHDVLMADGYPRVAEGVTRLV
jgi:glyoxylase-like metal-dependent hydrolase (beta-lactamase superfamily II)